eukprot:superscaffoldBa00003778_g17656
MLDCGIHPGLEGMDALPYIDLIDPAEIDLLLISHFHLDHCGALPWFLQKTSFKGRTFMTHATKAIYRWLLSDYVKVSNISADDMLYTETDLEESMEKIETINFHEVKEVAGIKFWCYHAGHVLGAAMFMIEIAGVKESTYGTHIHEKREEREARFCNTVHDIVNREGRCLIPVFALGRAQELLLILDEYWQNHPELHDIPIYYASSLARKCMAVYQTYINAMNDKIRKAININNPFVFKHISNLKSMDHFDDIGPSVVMASPGMMQSGLSRELFESWCTDKRNGVIIAGYCVEGTLAKHIMTEPDEIATMSGQKLPLKMSVDYISFSAHTDYQQTSEFIRALKPPHVILVHGEQNEMARLKAALIREYEDNDEVDIEVHNPRNTEAVTLNFRGEKLAKVPEDSRDVEQVDGAEKITIKIFKSITLVHEAGMVLLEVRVTFLTFLKSVSQSVDILGAVAVDRKPAQRHVRRRRRYGGPGGPVQPQRTEIDMFGDDCVNFKDGKNMSVTVDGVTASVDPETRSVTCAEDETLREMVEVAVHRLYDALSPTF